MCSNQCVERIEKLLKDYLQSYVLTNSCSSNSTTAKANIVAASAQQQSEQPHDSQIEDETGSQNLLPLPAGEHVSSLPPYSSKISDECRQHVSNNSQYPAIPIPLSDLLARVLLPHLPATIAASTAASSVVNPVKKKRKRRPRHSRSQNNLTMNRNAATHSDG